ncbi:outer membrane protein assembly factor BamE [Leeia sp. TBRC 13508]|uniref:Outer membrane protein assembly factor BamE n=1 Tax=Leeia speluncae TaxID=2884804 RepID=A0ABS8D8K4_9NEIS|nr:outer membrane protein assembly factor BamE [Leeia speluncae]MCB6184506.1 outer membrane protein assembly factor BamE [Leeia speluncae]
MSTPLFGRMTGTALVLVSSSLIALGLSGCGTATTVANAITPYKMDIIQGNYVTQDSVDKLKPGMTKAQVKFLLGTPLLQDAFHANRWDYVYRLYKDDQLVEQKQFTVWFENDALSKFSGDVMPAVRPVLKEATASGVAEKPASAPEMPASTAALVEKPASAS